MTDRFSPQQRSAIMARIRSRDTAIELRIRRLLHRSGYRYKVNVKELPGTPDLVFTKKKKVIFVHGCFWHGHKDCKRATLPASRIEFWSAKILRNKERDAHALHQLQEQGWTALVLWECELRDETKLGARLKTFLGGVRS